MADGLTISGGGSIAVATDDQLARVQSIEAFAEAVEGVLLNIGGLPGLVSSAELRAVNAPVGAFEVYPALDEAMAHLGAAARHARLIARATRLAMTAYGAAEHGQHFLMQSLADRVGFELGAHWPLVFFAAAPVAAASNVVMATAFIAGTSPAEIAQHAESFAQRHPWLLNNPLVVEGLELATGAVDDVLLGFAGSVPGTAGGARTVDQLFGDSGVGVFGVETAAGAIVVAGAAPGLFRDFPVAVEQVGAPTSLAAPPLTYAERIRNLPATESNGGAQIRVDKYFTNGRLTGAEVYLSGTQKWDIRGTDTPFDLTSNVRAVAGVDNGSLRAAELALDKAGVTRSVPVTFTGHSQGGILAHELAASGKYNVVGVLEAGPPASQTPLKPGTPEVVLAHDEDIVTGLGGARNDDAIVVSTTAFPGGEVAPDENVVSAHDSNKYVSTAAAVDHAQSSVLSEAKQSMNTTSAGATEMTTTLYKASNLTGHHK